MLPFTFEEYGERVAATKRRMEAGGIDLLFVSEPANMCYLTGYDATSDYVPQGVILAIDDDQPIWVGRAMDTACARYTVYMGEDFIFGYPEAYIGDHDLHPMTWIADLMRQRGWSTSRIGIEMDSMRLTYRSVRELERALPDAAFVSADLLVDWVRVIKSDQEIAYMRQAGMISDRAMQAAIDMIEPGVRQCDAAAEIYRALIRGSDEFGGGDPNGLTIPTGARASAPHLTWTDEPFRDAEMTNIELGGNRHRYFCGLSRTVACGRPPEKLSTLAPVVTEAMEAALDAAVPGATCSEVHAAWQGVMHSAGYEKESRIGYSIGIGWLERTASLQQGDQTVLQPNMTFHLMQGMWMEDWGYELSEVFRVAENGPPETFSDLERRLFIKP